MKTGSTENKKNYKNQNENKEKKKYSIKEVNKWQL